MSETLGKILFFLERATTDHRQEGGEEKSMEGHTEIKSDLIRFAFWIV